MSMNFATNVLPATNNTYVLGDSDHAWDSAQFNKATLKYGHMLYTGTGTAGTTGSSTQKYQPALWTFDTGMTPEAGDIITIKIPVAGVNSGIWMSVDNGVNYYPVATYNTGMLTTHYAVNNMITLIYQTGMSTKIYGTTTAGAAAGASTASVTMDRWAVLNSYDSNTTYSTMSVAEMTTGTATSNRVIRADYLKSGMQANIVGSATNGNLTVFGTDTTVYTLPTAASDVLGGIKIGNGIAISSGVVSTSKASTANIKTGTEQYNQIVPYNQHESVFYGLAKAAGDNTQSVSTNAVGTYTTDAKAAIHTMLDIPQPETMVNVNTMLTELGLNTNANLTAAVAGTSDLDHAVVQEG